MPIESATFVNSLVKTNPTSGDKKTTTDDHLRLIKNVLQNTFVNVTREVSASAGEMNYLSGLTSTAQTQINTTLSMFVAITSGSSTISNAVLWHGSTKFASTASASGTGTDGDFWFQFEN